MTICKRFLTPAPGRIIHVSSGAFWIEYDLRPWSIGPCGCLPRSSSGPFPSFESALEGLRKQNPHAVLI